MKNTTPLSFIKKKQTKKEKSSLVSGLVAYLFSMALIPAYSIYSYSKFLMLLPFLPLTWTIKKINPHIVEDIAKTKNKLKKTIRTTADKSLKTAGSFFFK